MAEKDREGQMGAGGGGGCYNSQYKNNYFAEKSSSFEEGSCLRLTDMCITQL